MCFISEFHRVSRQPNANSGTLNNHPGNSQPFRLLADPPNHSLIAHAQSLGLSLLEIQPPSESDVYLRRLEEQEGTRQARDDDDEEVPQIPGGGFTRALFIALKRAAVPVVAVLVFALEGGKQLCQFEVILLSCHVLHEKFSISPAR